MWIFEHAETTSATPHQLWALYAEPATWPQWDHEIAEVTIEGPVAVGNRGRLKPVIGPSASFTFTEINPGVGFTNVTGLPLARLTLAHHIEAAASGSRFTHHVTITGPFGPLFARLLGRRLAAGLPPAMRNLARLAEAAPTPSLPPRS